MAYDREFQRDGTKINDALKLEFIMGNYACCKNIILWTCLECAEQVMKKAVFVVSTLLIAQVHYIFRLLSIVITTCVWRPFLRLTHAPLPTPLHSLNFTFVEMFSVTPVLLSAAFAFVCVNAQVSTPSACVVSCITSAAAQGGCALWVANTRMYALEHKLTHSSTDLACVCSSAKVKSAATTCLLQQCSPTDQVAALQLQQQECASGKYIFSVCFPRRI